jgi:SpoVK/Ycf46/Vps4 family AAA+-type ATPase
LIEYYQGLLFLTTNRKDEFDEAFYNRIHVTIKYPELDAQARTNIWRYLLTKKRNAIKLDDRWSDHDFGILGDLRCNGRDIRNLIRTAYGYANSQRKELGVQHLLTVLRENMNIGNAEKIVSRLECALEMTATTPSEDLSGLGTRQKLIKPGDVSHDRNEEVEQEDAKPKHETLEDD